MGARRPRSRGEPLRRLHGCPTAPSPPQAALGAADVRTSPRGVHGGVRRPGHGALGRPDTVSTGGGRRAVRSAGHAPSAGDVLPRDPDIPARSQLISGLKGRRSSWFFREIPSRPGSVAGAWRPTSRKLPDDSTVGAGGCRRATPRPTQVLAPQRPARLHGRISALGVRWRPTATPRGEGPTGKTPAAAPALEMSPRSAQVLAAQGGGGRCRVDTGAWRPVWRKAATPRVQAACTAARKAEAPRAGARSAPSRVHDRAFGP